MATTKHWTEGRLARIATPLLIGTAALVAWEWLVWQREIPRYVLPAPSLIASTIWNDWSPLSTAWLVTLRTMISALLVAVLGGVLLAIVFSVSRVLEMSLFPYAIVLQVTPLIAIAPLINVWLGDRVWLVLLVCAWIVAFFPILSNTVIGLKSADQNLRDLMTLYHASSWQRLRHLSAPAALPYFLGGLKISANLSLVGAIVAEFAVGAGGAQAGLATTILESSFRGEIPRTFAALSLVSLTGIVTYFLIHGFSQWMLGSWHESALKGEV